MESLKMYIDNQWIDSRSGETIETKNPANMEILAKFPRSNADDVDKAVQAASKAFESTEWREILPAEKSRIMLKIASLIRENKDELAELETLDMGKPLTQAYADVEVAARYFEYFGGAADKILGETIPINSEMLDYTVREPFGVTAHIVPWNYPLQMTARSVAPALAAGNTVVVKPAEDTSITTLKIAELIEKTDLPKGVFNVVTGYGHEAGDALSLHPDIDHITFTGSVPTGSTVMRNAAKHIKSVTLELGGKSPNIVFADADLEEAADWVVRTIIQNTGQTCTAGSRLLVEKSIKDEFLNKVTEIMSKVTIGPGIEDKQMGPVVSEKQMENLKKYMKVADEEGTEIIRGGKAKEGLPSGLFFEPTLVIPKSKSSRLAQEELFGPVVAAFEFETLEEALELANSTEYGLVTGIWTSNINKALWLSQRVRSGQVFVNNYGAGGGVEMPFGGQGKSGFGREKGLESLKHYTQVKNVAIKIRK